ncbi:SM-20-related protein [Chitinophaga ginsengisegetis]|uniref:SM-20-related protein n=1 Tax=Chitinophaga ginsengisegetis TaxID=393003 RepID=A0A1T5P9V5_9BACT|nr:2OG-Fe(II) oxygenase [Chitinophaga ginsengisegetis]SKD09407.1 SM-20-related protein [Chitinophaga ginsengisegetis]
MQQAFDTLINSFIESKVGISENFLSSQLSNDLKENLLHLHSEKSMLAAGTGNQPLVNQDKSVRGDIIYWLDRQHNNAHENAFFDVMDAFVAYLNQSCYTGITGYEFHYTLYETGSFYKKHLDQFRNNDSRQYSMIIYLNAGWLPADGGQLSIYHANGDAQQVDPSSGKTVFFKSSELEHEVQLTNKPRLSITGWLKR